MGGMRVGIGDWIAAGPVADAACGLEVGVLGRYSIRVGIAGWMAHRNGTGWGESGNQREPIWIPAQQIIA